MKIGFFTTLSLRQPSAPVHHVLNRTRAMALEGHGVTLIHPAPRLTPEASTPARRDVPVAWPPFRGGGRFYIHRAFAGIRRMAAAGEIDVLLMRTDVRPDLIPLLNRLSIPRAMEVHGYEVAELPDFPAFGRAVDLILVPSEELRAICRARLGPADDAALDGRVQVHEGPGVDAERFSPGDRAACRKELGWPEDRTIWLHVSGFQAHHDFRAPLAALKRLNAEGGRHLLVFAGDGARRPDVEREAAPLIASGDVLMPGAVPGARLPVLIGGADVCFSTSTAESLVDGNLRAFKLLEYAACARPVVVSVDERLPVAAWAKDALGLVPPEAPDAIMNTVRDILARPDAWKARCESGRRYVTEQRSWSGVARSTLAPLARLLDDARRVPAAR